MSFYRTFFYKSFCIPELEPRLSQSVSKSAGFSSVKTIKSQYFCSKKPVSFQKKNSKLFKMDIGNNSETREFLEKCLKEKILSFENSPGSKPGEGFTAEHYLFEVELAESKGKKQNLFLKCFPALEIRQNILSQLNLFYRESRIYTEIIPELYKLQKELTGVAEPLPIQLSIPEIISANGVNYSDSNVKGDPKDNYILMTDMKNEFGFKKLDNFHRINYQEAEMIINELAKWHSLSWAYKKTHGLQTLTAKFPSVADNFYCDQQKAGFLPFLPKHSKIFLDACEEKFGQNSKIVKSAQEFVNEEKTEYLWEILKEMVHFDGVDEKKIEGLLKKPFQNGLADPIEDPWTVLSQADLWINNLLFKHNDQNQLEKVVLLDFQFTRESCPTLELAYLLYICADGQFRKNYLLKILQFYHKTFLHYCEILHIEPFPHFTMDNLQRRFHRARLYGVLSGIWVSPVIFHNPDDQEKKVTGENPNKTEDEYFEETFGQFDNKGTPLKEILIEIAEEAFEIGIF